MRLGLALVALLLVGGLAWAAEDGKPSVVEPPPADGPGENAKPAPPARPAELKLALDVTIVTAVTVEMLKRAFKDPRPHEDERAHGRGYGFPSGDAALAFALARVATEYHPKQKVLWYLLAARVAWSRVRREAHDWEDVIGGAVVGSVIGGQAVAQGGLVLVRVGW